MNSAADDRPDDDHPDAEPVTDDIAPAEAPVDDDADHEALVEADEAPRRMPVALLGVGIGVGLVAVVGAVVVAVLMFTGGGSDDTPQATFEEYVAALRDGDCVGAVSQFHPEVRNGVTPAIFCSDAVAEDVAASIADISFEYGETTISGDTATLVVTETVGTGDDAFAQDWNYTLEQIDGDWLIKDASPLQ